MPRPHARWTLTALLALACTSPIAVPGLAAAAEATTTPESTVAADVIASADIVAPVVVRFEDDDLGVVYSGAWQSTWQSNASGGSYRVSSRSGSVVSATFEGQSVGLIGRRGPDRGRLRIVLDGVQVAEIDSYDASRSGQWLLWQSELLASGTHTIAVEVLGASESSPAATSVVFDAFEIAGAPVRGKAAGTGIADGSKRLAKTGRWWVSKRKAAIGGRGWRTRSKGAAVTVRFRGTGILWFGLKDADGGLAEVLLDGKKVATVSQYRDTATEQAVAFAVAGLPEGTHRLTVRALGRKGEGGDAKVDVDGFLVAGAPLKAYAPSPFRYRWKSYIVIDKSEYKLYWVRDGVVIRTYPVAVGRVGMTTPSRVWRVGIKYKTDPRGVYGPRKLRLFKRVNGRYVFTAYGIHGTNQEWVIGTRASHGCIRMYNKDVRELWPQVPVGTMVITRD